MPAASVLLPPELCVLLPPAASEWPQQQRPADTTANVSLTWHHICKSHEAHVVASNSSLRISAAVSASCSAGKPETLVLLLHILAMHMFQLLEACTVSLTQSGSLCRILATKVVMVRTFTHLLLSHREFVCLGLALWHAWLIRLTRSTCWQHKCCSLDAPVLCCCRPDLPRDLPGSSSIVIAVAGLLWHCCCCCRQRVWRHCGCCCLCMA